MKFKALLAIVLSISMLTTGCSATWINVALADLPVLVQMALNIGSLVSTLQSGTPIPQGEQAAINNISAEANKDLILLQSLYTQYKANPSEGLIQQMEVVIGEIDTNLPQLLSAAHIADPVLSARIEAAVQLILTTVESFSALIPQPITPKVAAIKNRIAVGTKPPTPAQLKQQWNEKVYPQFSVKHGFWSGLGTAIGEAKFGG